MSRSLRISALPLLLTGLACGDSSTGLADIPPPGLTWVDVRPPSADILVGGSLTFRAYRVQEGGPGTQISTSWRSWDPVVASVDDGGTARGLAPGSVDIEAVGHSRLGSLTVSLAEGQPWPGEMRLASLSAGWAHSCGLAGEGEIHCWGSNDHAQIAPVSPATARFVPVSGALSAPLVTLVSGAFHACGLTAIGTAYCWGWNDMGQLGDGSEATRGAPTLVAGGPPFRSIHPGVEHTCGLDVEGRAHCWGLNGDGALGTAQSATYLYAPTPVVGDRAFRHLALSRGFTCGISVEDAVYCWGYVPPNVHGPVLREPTLVSDERAYAAIEAAEMWICAIDSAGEAWCWGRHPGIGVDSDVPLPVEGGLAFVPSSLSVAGPEGTACALTADGEAYCWGHLPDAQSLARPSATPVPVPGGHRFSRVAVGWFHACGLTTAGDAYCWGWNRSGQLGTGRTEGSDDPVRVLGQPDA